MTTNDEKNARALFPAVMAIPVFFGLILVHYVQLFFASIWTFGASMIIGLVIGVIFAAVVRSLILKRYIGMVITIFNTLLAGVFCAMVAYTLSGDVLTVGGVCTGIFAAIFTYKIYSAYRRLKTGDLYDENYSDFQDFLDGSLNSYYFYKVEMYIAGAVLFIWLSKTFRISGVTCDVKAYDLFVTGALFAWIFKSVLLLFMQFEPILWIVSIAISLGIGAFAFFLLSSLTSLILVWKIVIAAVVTIVIGAINICHAYDVP